MASFINAKEPSEIVFTRNATEAINLVAYSWGLTNLRAGDEVQSSLFTHTRAEACHFSALHCCQT